MTKNNHKKRPLQDYARYSGLGIQMAVLIFGGVWGGLQLDALFHLNFPILTLLFTTLGVVAAVYFAIKDFIKK